MQKLDAKAVAKKLTLNSETIRNLKGDQTSPALIPTMPPGCRPN